MHAFFFMSNTSYMCYVKSEFNDMHTCPLYIKALTLIPGKGFDGKGGLKGGQQGLGGTGLGFQGNCWNCGKSMSFHRSVAMR